MQWALVNSNNIIENLIAYDGGAPYEPAEGLTLMQVNDWLLIGEKINKAESSVLDNLIANFTIDQRRAFCVTALINERDAQIVKNITVNGNVFFADQDSINVMHEAITMQGLGIDGVFPTNWVLAVGGTINLSYSDAQAVASAIATRKNLAFANYMSLRASIMSAPTPEAVNIKQGWPT